MGCHWASQSRCLLHVSTCLSDSHAQVHRDCCDRCTLRHLTWHASADQTMELRACPPPLSYPHPPGGFVVPIIAPTSYGTGPGPSGSLGANGGVALEAAPAAPGGARLEVLRSMCCFSNTTALTLEVSLLLGSDAAAWTLVPASGGRRCLKETLLLLSLSCAQLCLGMLCCCFSFLFLYGLGLGLGKVLTCLSLHLPHDLWTRRGRESRGQRRLRGG